jgi:hypothetical protein
MRVGDRCEIRITWRSKGTWFGGQVVAIAANERSIKVAWIDPDGGERETEAPIRHVREPVQEAEPVRKPRRFKATKVASTPSTSADGEALPSSTPSTTAPQAAGGWIETYFVHRCGREYGPYRKRCWREGGRKRSQYLGGGF